MPPMFRPSRTSRAGGARSKQAHAKKIATIAYFHGRIARGGALYLWSLAMRKERVSATQLADMITSQIGASGVEVSVRKDLAYDWLPTILVAPSDVIGFQRRANEIAHRLRVRFDLHD